MDQTSDKVFFTPWETCARTSTENAGFENDLQKPEFKKVYYPRKIKWNEKNGMFEGLLNRETLTDRQLARCGPSMPLLHPDPFDMYITASGASCKVNGKLVIICVRQKMKVFIH